MSRAGKPALIFLAAFVLYYVTRDHGLDNADSVQYAMGVHDFDLWRSRPHPPGFPIYIFFGWITHLVFGWSAEFALNVVSCLGGALFVTAWFGIARVQFGPGRAFLLAIALAVTPVVWMSSTRVASDIAAAGFFSAALLGLCLFKRDRRLRDLILASVLAAAAAGVRPQYLPIIAVMLGAFLWQTASSVKTWLIAGSVLLAGCALWLGPMWYLQWRLRTSLSWWQVYPHLISEQWRWRLHNPQMYLGAGNGSFDYLRDRLLNHFGGWFMIGLGFARSTSTLMAGFALTVSGMAAYFFRLRPEDRAFWRSNWAWATAHCAFIFGCEGWQQRFYLPIFPLLLIAVLFGFLRGPGEIWKLGALAMPLLLVCISLPLALENHTIESPPTRFVRYLQDLHPPIERPHVLLILMECHRHAQWYAPEFPIVIGVTSLAQVKPAVLANAFAVYTDNPDLLLSAGWSRSLAGAFVRSDLINASPSQIVMYQLVHSEQ